MSETKILEATDYEVTVAILGILETIKRRGYMVGTDLILTKEEDMGWCISDLEQEIIFSSPLILKTVRQFIEMETPKVINMICGGMSQAEARVEKWKNTERLPLSSTD